MSKIFIFIFSLCLFCKQTSIRAEILEAVMKWDALLCLNICEPTLRRELNNITNIDSLVINARAGTAIMRWKPNYPFSYEPFNLATRVVGIRIADFRLRILGTITRVEDNYYIVSRGDNTTFLLLGPILAVPDRYIIQQNIASHPLSADMRMQLLGAAQNRTLVEIEGPLFEPLRYLLTIVIEQLKFPKGEVPVNTIKEIEKYKLPKR